ncbi:hypothetical protein L596_017979 [Steinernema carpocapsae]|uniref:Uncharacterized protein n=1 Tax=Steinernema carpocapsae TaxID=34508 RepID=A0A4U5N3A0_STECR|nr:hypothetical protein L596_017979 [Steinernema carpocapsae]
MQLDLQNPPKSSSLSHRKHKDTQTKNPKKFRNSIELNLLCYNPGRRESNGGGGQFNQSHTCTDVRMLLFADLVLVPFYEAVLWEYNSLKAKRHVVYGQQRSTTLRWSRFAFCLTVKEPFLIGVKKAKWCNYG